MKLQTQLFCVKKVLAGHFALINVRHAWRVYQKHLCLSLHKSIRRFAEAWNWFPSTKISTLIWIRIVAGSMFTDQKAQLFSLHCRWNWIAEPSCIWPQAGKHIWFRNCMRKLHLRLFTIPFYGKLDLIKKKRCDVLGINQLLPACITYCAVYSDNK